MKDPKLVQVAVTAFVKDWVKRRNDAGETTPEIARSLGFKSHASVVQYLTPGHPVKVTDAIQRRVAEIAFGGSRDRLDEEAIRWFDEQKDESAESEFPPQVDAALTFLRRTHGRDFTEAARAVIQSAAHRPENITIDSLAAQIYEEANRESGNSVAKERVVSEVAAYAPGMGGARKQGKGS